MKKVIVVLITILLSFSHTYSANESYKRSKDSADAVKNYKFNQFFNKVSNINLEDNATNTGILFSETQKITFNYFLISKDSQMKRVNCRINGHIGSNDNILQNRFVPSLKLNFGLRLLTMNQQFISTSEVNKLFIDDVLLYKHFQSLGKKKDTAKSYTLQEITNSFTIDEARLIKLSWFNISGDWNYNEQRSIDSAAAKSTISKLHNFKVNGQFNYLSLERSTIDGKKKKSPLLFSLVAGATFNLNGDNTTSLERIELTERFANSNNSGMTITNSVYNGKIVNDIKLSGYFSALLTFLHSNKYLLGIGIDYQYARFVTEKMNESTLRVNIPIGNVVDQDIVTTLKNIKFIPYFEMRNFMLNDKLSSHNLIGLSAILPIASLANP